MRHLLTSHRQLRDQRPPEFPWELNADCASAQGLVGFWPLGYESYSERNAAIGTPQLDMTPTAAPALVTTGDMRVGRQFVAGSTQYLEANFVAVSAEPLTLACWASELSIGATAQCMLSISNVSGTSARWNIGTAGTTGLVRAVAQDSSGSAFGIATSSAMIVGEWTHMAAVFSGSASRAAYRNGTAKGTNTTSVTVSGVNRTTIGASRIAVAAQYADAWISHACLWNRDLAEAEVAALYDPGTRWELYYPIGRKTWSFSPAVGGAFQKLAGVRASLAAMCGLAG